MINTVSQLPFGLTENLSPSLSEGCTHPGDSIRRVEARPWELISMCEAQARHHHSTNTLPLTFNYLYVVRQHAFCPFPSTSTPYVTPVYLQTPAGLTASLAPSAPPIASSAPLASPASMRSFVTSTPLSHCQERRGQPQQPKLPNHHQPKLPPQHPP